MILPLVRSLRLEPGATLSIAVQLRRVLIALLTIQALLASLMIGGALLSASAVHRLIEDRMAPISELQGVTDSYVAALTTAHKVKSNNLSRMGAIDAIKDARARIAADWAHFREHDLDDRHADAVARIDTARANADAAIETLSTMLRAKKLDDLEFFLSGRLYAAIDPLTVASATLIDDLRADAEREQEALAAHYNRAYVILALASVLAVLVGLWGARLVSRRIAAPLAEIAVATHRIADDRDASAIPGLDREDEIGDIARALRLARERSREARRLA
uniref:HAMP domain-containing protein n=1 Tax=Solanum lycopersicum TaxID=4081 RepID=A0A494G9D9_SOLLC